MDETTLLRALLNRATGAETRDDKSSTSARMIMAALTRGSKRRTAADAAGRMRHLELARGLWREHENVGLTAEARRECEMWISRTEQVCASSSLEQLRATIAPWHAELLGVGMGVTLSKWRTTHKARKALYMCTQARAWELLMAANAPPVAKDDDDDDDDELVQ